MRTRSWPCLVLPSGHDEAESTSLAHRRREAVAGSGLVLRAYPGPCGVGRGE